MRDGRPEKVLISYSHDSDVHRQAVRALADRLRADGVECMIDQYVPFQSPPEGWPRWMRDRLEESDFVLLVFTETYRRRLEGREAPGKGSGVTFEGQIVTQELYEAHMTNRRFIPVLMTKEDASHITIDLRATRHYIYPAEYADLYRQITGQPDVVMPEIGTQRVLPPIDPVTLPPVEQRHQERGLLSLLQPRGHFLGRTDEVAKVLAFLNSQESWATVRAANVAGAGGIGKTEVCKAALREWVQEHPEKTVYFIPLAGARSAVDLLSALGQAVGAPGGASEQQVLERVQDSPGLYYLDNLESVVDDAAAREIFERLKTFPDVRVLSSSRERLPGLGRDLILAKLPDAAALELFRTTWREAGGDELADSQLLREFVGAETARDHVRTLNGNLGCHALSLVLVAAHVCLVK